MEKAPFMKPKIKMWLHGLVGGVIGGGAQAVLSASGIALASAAVPDITPLDMRQVPIMFLSGAVISTMLYLAKSPLPPTGDTTFTDKPKQP